MALLLGWSLLSAVHARSLSAEYFLSDLKMNHFSQKESIATPYRTDTCVTELLEILKGGRTLLNRNSDSINQIISSIDNIRKRETCSIAGKALANCYYAQLLWGKYNRSSYVINQRTPVLGAIPKNMEIWSKNIYLSQIEEALKASLNDPIALRKIPAKAVGAFLTPTQAMPGVDLYQVLSDQALSLLKEIQSDNNDLFHFSPEDWLIPMEEFVKKDLPAKMNPTLHFILSIYQQKLRFSLADRKTTQLVKEDIDRLTYIGLRLAYQPAIYLKSLEALYQRYENQPESVLILKPLIEQKNRLENKETSNEQQHFIQVCADLLHKYPNVPGSCELQNLKYELESGKGNIELNPIYAQNEPISITLHYTNVREIRLTLIGENQRIIASRLIKPEKGTKNIQDTVTFAGLPYGKYSVRSAAIPLPITAPAAKWKIESKPEQVYKNEIPFTVSDIMLIPAVLPDNSIQLLTVNRRSGKPLEHVTIEYYEVNYKRKNPVLLGSVRSNSDGLSFITDKRKSGSLMFRAFYEGDKFLPDRQEYLRLRSPEQDLTRTRLFTDRSVYRPGQTVYYKAFLYRTTGEETEALEGQRVTVSLQNTQFDIIDKSDAITDRFGAISGEFRIPETTMNGMFRISTPSGSVSFQVAAYKQPTFEVLLQKPRQEYTSGDSVRITGSIKTYTGVALEDAQIAYDIKFIPSRWYGNEIFLQSGNIQTNPDGDFSVQFLSAIAGKTGFYLITATATSLSGETQTGSILIPVHTSYQITIESGEKTADYLLSGTGSETLAWNKRTPQLVTVKVLDLNTKPVMIDGKLMLYRFKPAQLAFPNVIQDTIKTFVKEIAFESNKEFRIDPRDLPDGIYELRAEVSDDKQRVLYEVKKVIVYAAGSPSLPVVTTKWLEIPKDTCEIGENVTLSVGTSAKEAYLLMQVFSNEKTIQTQRFILSDEIKTIAFPYKKEYGQEIQVCFTYVKENQMISFGKRIYLKKADEKLVIRKESFRDKLLPGQQETWTFGVTNVNEKPIEVQVLADMYDISLDAIYKDSWNPSFRPYPNNYRFFWNTENRYNNNTRSDFWRTVVLCQTRPDIMLNMFDIANESGMIFMAVEDATRASSKVVGYAAENGIQEMRTSVIPEDEELSAEQSPQQQTQVRANLEQTAFFYPKLMTDSAGLVKIQFTVPELLTKWNLRLLATTPEMRSAYLSTEVVTSKELMVMPTLPRFVRQGDSICIASLILNQSELLQAGTAKIEIFNPVTGQIIYQDRQPFSIASGQNGSVTFCVGVPLNADLLGVRIYASTPTYQDGEQQILPVLPSRTLVTESMPMNVSGKGSQTFRFTNYLKPHSATLDNYRYTVEYTGNPAWYAVQALPTLSPITNQSANRGMASYYVNTLASYIARSDSGIQKAIEMWKRQSGDRQTLISNLEKNESLKQILLSETPWVMQATNETENMQALAQLFNSNRLIQLQGEAASLLLSLQNADGGIAWFKGMPSSMYQTLDVLEGFSRLVALNALEVPADIKMMQMRALQYVDQKSLERYQEAVKSVGKSQWTPDRIDLLWAYVRSSYRDVPFYGESLPLHKLVLSYFRKHTDALDLYESALLSLTLRRYGFVKESDQINDQLKQMASYSEIMGMYWANNREGVLNEVNEIRTHVLLMAALFEGGASEKEINQLKLWLLCQKQTQQWQDVPATVDAMYGILMTGSSWLTHSQAPVVKVGGKEIAPNPYLAYADTVYSGNAIIPQLGVIEITQREDHPAYGAAYWQYYEDFNKLKQTGRELVVEKKLFKEVRTTDGVAMEPVTASLRPGDIVVTRLVVTATRNYDFVTLKDQRAACFEPVNQLSGYQWDQGTGYYLETENATTNYFFTSLQRGTYVFEYRVKVVQKGLFHDGISSIQCLYAPQFVGHTQGSTVRVE